LSIASDNFEKFVHRIHELVETPDSQVVWNDHVPDPDNPKQPRQIDVAIRRDGRLTLVECRLHSTRQGVKWIEELIGRRVSLQASEVVAVSDAGFTIGAVRKAKRFGVLLRDLESLTDAEISAWGRSHNVFLYFYTFDRLHVTLVLDLPEITPADGDAVAKAFKVSKDAAAICNAVVGTLDAEQWLPKRLLDQPQTFEYGLQRPDFHLAGVAVSSVKTSGSVRLVERQIECGAVRAYGPPEAQALSRDVVVEKFNLGETGLVQHAEATSFVVDVTAIQMPPLSQLRFVRLAGEVETDLASFELIGADRFRVSARAIQLTLVAKVP
jgi:hypothetical protein